MNYSMEDIIAITQAFSNLMSGQDFEDFMIGTAGQPCLYKDILDGKVRVSMVFTPDGPQLDIEALAGPYVDTPMQVVLDRYQGIEEAGDDSAADATQYTDNFDGIVVNGFEQTRGDVTTSSFEARIPTEVALEVLEAIFGDE